MEEELKVGDKVVVEIPPGAKIGTDYCACTDKKQETEMKEAPQTKGIIFEVAKVEPLELEGPESKLMICTFGCKCCGGKIIVTKISTNS